MFRLEGAPSYRDWSKKVQETLTNILQWMFIYLISFLKKQRHQILKNITKVVIVTYTLKICNKKNAYFKSWEAKHSDLFTSSVGFKLM